MEGLEVPPRDNLDVIANVVISLASNLGVPAAQAEHVLLAAAIAISTLLVLAVSLAQRIAARRSHEFAAFDD